MRRYWRAWPSRRPCTPPAPRVPSLFIRAVVIAPFWPPAVAFKTAEPETIAHVASSSAIKPSRRREEKSALLPVSSAIVASLRRSIWSLPTEPAIMDIWPGPSVCACGMTDWTATSTAFDIAVAATASSAKGFRTWVFMFLPHRFNGMTPGFVFPRFQEAFL